MAQCDLRMEISTSQQQSVSNDSAGIFTSPACTCFNGTSLNTSSLAMCSAETTGVELLLIVVQTYVTPLVLVLGILGSVMACVVLIGGELKALPCSVYLSALAVSDTCFLTAVVISWLKIFNLNIYALPMTCEFLTLISNGTNFLCSWYLVCLAMDRYIFVCWPRFRGKCCSTFRAKIVVTTIAIVAVVIFVNTTIMVGVVKSMASVHCAPLPKFFQTVRTLEKLDVFFNMVVPFCVILVLICCICQRLLTKGHRISFRRSERRDSSRRVVRSWSSQAELRLTTSVLIYLVGVFILQLPGHTFRIATMIKEIGQQLYQLPFRDFILHEIFQCLFYLSFAIKPFLLLATWREFRKSFVASVAACCSSVCHCWGSRKLVNTEINMYGNRRRSSIRQFPSAEALKDVSLV